MQQLQQEGELHIFAPVAGQAPTHDSRQAWLRTALLAALPMSEVAARALVSHVSPHSFRSGLAGDLLREGVSLQKISSVCRWWSLRAARLYAERPPLSTSRSTSNFRIITFSL